MTTTMKLPPLEVSASHLQEVEQRSTTDIAPEVIERMAAVVALEIHGVGGSARRVLNVAVGSDDKAKLPRVEAHIAGGIATLNVECTIAYPQPIAWTSTRLREHLQSTLETLTGIRIAKVNIELTSLRDDVETKQRRVS